MEKIFLDTNILIDILAARKPFYFDSKALLEQINEYVFVISSISVTNSYYIAKINDQLAFRDFIKEFNISLTDYGVIMKAFDLKMKDFEDAIQLASCINSGCNIFVTWNKKDFKRFENSFDIITPREFITLKRLT